MSTSKNVYKIDFMKYHELDLSPKTRFELAAGQSFQAWFQLHDELTDYRRNNRISQQSVADEIGITQPAVSVFEGENSDARISSIVSYAAAMGLKINFSFETVNWPSSD